MAAKVKKCNRCRRRYRGHGEWNAVFRDAVIVGYLCPDCQTPDEVVEAEVHKVVYDCLGVEAAARSVAPQGHRNG